MFQLTKEEWKNLIFQNGISRCEIDENLKCQIGTSRYEVDENLKSQIAISSWGGRRKLPYVFTEQGIAMLSGLLNSDIAIKVNIQIMRAFVKMRQYAFGQSSQDSRIDDLRKILMLHIESNDNKFSEYDETINQIIQVLNNLIEQPKPKKQIGFTAQP